MLNKKETVESLVHYILLWLFLFCTNIKLFPKTVKQCNMVLILVLVAIGFVLQGRFCKKHTSLIIAWGLYICFVGVQLLLVERNSNYSFASVIFLYLICPSLVFFFYYLSNSQIKLCLESIMIPFIVAEIFLSGCALYEFFSAKYILSSNNVADAINTIKYGASQGLLRASVFSSSYLLLGDYLGIGFLFCVLTFCRKRKLSYLLVSILLFIAVCTTLSRGSLVVVGCAFIALFIILFRQGFRINKKVLLILMAIFVATVAVLFATGNNKFLIVLWNRIISIFDWSKKSSGNASRLRHWKYFFEQWTSSTKNFFIGVGISNAAYGNSFGRVTESGLLENLVELGLVGSLFYYCVLLYPMIGFLKQKNKSDSSILCFCCLLMFLLHDLILQVGISVDGRVMIWLLNGLLFYFNEEVRKEKNDFCYHSYIQ